MPSYNFSQFNIKNSNFFIHLNIESVFVRYLPIAIRTQKFNYDKLPRKPIVLVSN